MKSIRGITPEFTVCGNPNLNIFCARFNKTDVILHQPRKKDMGKQKLALRDMSENTLKRYRRMNVNKRIYDIGYRSKLPLYRGEVPGFLPLVMEVDKTIVAFVDIFFKMGSEFSRFEVKETDKCCNCSIGVLDHYQGLGLGTAYSFLTDEIGRHFGCDFILGSTYINGGMRNIRIRDGWEKIREYGGMINHRKSLKPTTV